MKWWIIKHKLRDFWYWLKWFVRSRNGRRMVARQLQIPIFEIASCPEIKLSEIKARRFGILDRNWHRDNCPDGCLYVYDDEWISKA